MPSNALCYTYVCSQCLGELTSRFLHTRNRALELQHRLESIESAAGSEHSTNLALASRLGKLESELRMAQAGLRTAEASGKALNGQLQVRCGVIY